VTICLWTIAIGIPLMVAKFLYDRTRLIDDNEFQTKWGSLTPDLKTDNW